MDGNQPIRPIFFSPSMEHTYRSFIERTWLLPVGQGRIFWTDSAGDDGPPGMACFVCKLPESFVERPKHDDLGDSYSNFMGMITTDTTSGLEHPIMYFAFSFEFFSKPSLRAYESLNPADPMHNMLMRKLAHGPEGLLVLLIGPKRTDYLPFGIGLPAGHQKKLREVLDDFDARKLPSSPEFEAMAREIYRTGGPALQKTLYE